MFKFNPAKKDAINWNNIELELINTTIICIKKFKNLLVLASMKKQKSD